MEEVKEKLSTVALISLIHLIDRLFTKIGDKAGEKILCTMGTHDWEDVPGNKKLRFCKICGTIDDKRTDGIDQLTERKKRWIKRVRRFREWRNERKRRRESAKRN